MRVREGLRVGPYELLERIGRGGMATVYRAYHSALDRDVAIKVLPDFFAEHAEYRDRFQREARSVARLTHPNIVDVFDFGYHEETPYIVMELVDGATLEDQMRAPMALETALAYLEPVAKALDYAHSHGVLHRDIKPTNILIRRDGAPVLGDFGLSVMLDAKLRHTAADTVLGTAEYMSPEQARGYKTGPASDRYSLAVVAYEMLTGRLPFEAGSAAALLVSLLTEPVPHAEELKGELMAHVEEVLRRGLSKNPDERHPSATAFVRALQPAAWLTASDEETDLPPRLSSNPSMPRVPSVLVVDDGEANRELIKACLRGVDCEVRLAQDGFAALKAIEQSRPDLVLLDVQMPGMDGYEVCERIKSGVEGRLLPVVMITALDQTADRVRALAAGADDYMAKPVDRLELVARVRSALRLKRVYDSLNAAEQVIYSLAAAVEAKDPYTEAHTRRVAESARRIGARMGLPADELDALYRGGMIHDIGKIGVPDHILLKPGELDAEELIRMHLHPIIGENIVAPLQSSGELLPMIRHHHEHYDGTGYPDRLAGERIPLMARIISVCDAYDALTNDRPYRPRQTRERAAAILRGGAGRQWDPRIVWMMLEEAG